MSAASILVVPPMKELSPVSISGFPAKFSGIEVSGAGVSVVELRKARPEPAVAKDGDRHVRKEDELEHGKPDEHSEAELGVEQQEADRDDRHYSEASERVHREWTAVARPFRPHGLCSSCP